MENHEVKFQVLQHHEIRYIHVFVWVPGHTGILGNERVDEAAKQATQANSDLFVYINNVMHHQWFIDLHTPGNKSAQIKERTTLALIESTHASTGNCSDSPSNRTHSPHSHPPHHHSFLTRFPAPTVTTIYLSQ